MGACGGGRCHDDDADEDDNNDDYDNDDDGNDDNDDGMQRWQVRRNHAILTWAKVVGRVTNFLIISVNWLTLAI